MTLAEMKIQEQVLIRQTSDQWGISKDRVAAIIRLKALEEAWSLPTQESNNGKSNTALQLSFEQGMENVLGVEKRLVRQVDEDVNELVNRKAMRKSKFYGFEFVPMDSPLSIERVSKGTDSTITSEASQVTRRRYHEEDIPSQERVRMHLYH